MTEEYAPEEPEHDPDHEPHPDDGIEAEPPEQRPEPEDRRDPPLTTEEAKAKSLAWVRKIRAENALPTKPDIRSGRD